LSYPGARNAVLVAEPGFEPGLWDSKSRVLPLHHSALRPYAFVSGAEGRTRTGTRVTPQQILSLDTGVGRRRFASMPYLRLPETGCLRRLASVVVATGGCSGGCLFKPRLHHLGSGSSTEAPGRGETTAKAYMITSSWPSTRTGVEDWLTASVSETEDGSYRHQLITEVPATRRSPQGGRRNP
jgi:hypothetical protein